MSSLTQRITEDIRTVMRAKDKARLGVLRLISAAIKQREVDERITLDETQVIAVLDKMVKQRRESLEQYRSAGREDLARQEEFELNVLRDYLPEPLSESELEQLIDSAVQSTGAAGIKDMGQVMGVLRPQVQGRADMSAVSTRVKARLNG